MSSDSPNVEQIKFMERMSSLPQDVRFIIDSAWIDSLKEYNQTDCKEYKDFEKTLTSDTIRHALRHHYLNPSPEKVSEKKRACCAKKN